MNKNGKIKNALHLTFFTATLALILCGCIVLVIMINVDRHRTFRAEIDTSAGIDEKKDIVVAVAKSKQWEDYKSGKHLYGAEYDGIVKNNKRCDIDRWTLTIDLPCEYHVIDSSWNGAYSIEGNSIILTPDDFIFTIPRREEKTFGFVMYTDTDIMPEHFVITGHICRHLQDYALFWILVVSAIMWISSYVMYMIMSARLARMKQMQEHSDRIISETMETFAGLVDAKDPYTRGHSVRVAEYTRRLARGLGFNEYDVKQLGYIGLMHDCGKIGIPDAVLNKPDRLNEQEYGIIESHTTKGGAIVEKFTAIDGIRDGVLYHHERYDGKGYPEGLAGEKIPVCARIIGVADSFDAMNSDRVYRKHLSREKILDELLKNSGTQFDPKIAALMIQLIENGTIKTMD